MHEMMTFKIDYEKEYERLLKEKCDLEVALNDAKELNRQKDFELTELKAIITTVETLIGREFMKHDYSAN